jgi:hypothetical protein
MKNDEIINLAIENTIHGLKFDEEGLLRFAKLVAQHEREACAKVCDDHCGWTPRMIGSTIRARGHLNDTSSERVDLTGENKHD